MNPLQETPAYFEPRIDQAVFDLLNDLLSLSPRLLSPVPGFEDEFVREQAIGALSAVHKFLCIASPAPEPREPILALLAALSDAKNGRNNPLFRLGSPAPESSSKRILALSDDCLAAAAVTILVSSGTAKTSAALGEVAKKLGYSPTKLAALRKNLMSPDAGRDRAGQQRPPKASKQALEEYNFFIKMFHRSGLTARQFVSTMINRRAAAKSLSTKME